MDIIKTKKAVSINPNRYIQAKRLAETLTLQRGSRVTAPMVIEEAINKYVNDMESN